MTITAKINTRFRSKAKAATNPGTPKYQTIMNNNTITIDQMIAWVPFAIVADPNDAPILFSLSGTGFSVPGKEPARRIPIIWSTRAWVKSPSITPLSEIRLLIFAEDNKLPSRTIDSCLSIFPPVNRPNFPALVAFIVNATLGRMLPSYVDRTFFRSSPVTLILSSGSTIRISIREIPAGATMLLNSFADLAPPASSNTALIRAWPSFEESKWTLA